MQTGCDHLDGLVASNREFGNIKSNNHQSTGHHYCFPMVAKNFLQSTFTPFSLLHEKSGIGKMGPNLNIDLNKLQIIISFNFVTESCCSYWFTNGYPLLNESYAWVVDFWYAK